MSISFHHEREFLPFWGFGVDLVKTVAQLVSNVTRFRLSPSRCTRADLGPNSSLTSSATEANIAVTSGLSVANP